MNQPPRLPRLPRLPFSWKKVVSVCAALALIAGNALVLASLSQGSNWGVLGEALLGVGLAGAYWLHRQQVNELNVEISRLQAHQAPLMESERFLRLLTDSLPVRIAYFDLEFRYRFVNRAQCARFGTTVEQTLGRTRQELLGEEAAPVMRKSVNALLGGAAQQFEFDDVVNGDVRHIDSHLVPDLNKDGTVRGFFALGTDVTDRVNTERALRELTSVFESTSDFVVQTDRSGIISYLNPAIRIAMGWTPDGATTQHRLYDFCTASTRQLFRQTIWPALRIKGLWLGKIDLCWPGVDRLPVQSLLIAHRNGDGRVERYSAVMRDISEEIQVQHEAARQAASLYSVAEAIPAAVAVVDADGVYQYINKAFEDWLGMPRDQVTGKKGIALLGEYEFNRRWPWALRALAGEHVSYRLDYPGRERTRYMAIDYIPLKNEFGQGDGFVIVAQDISEQVHEEERLLRISEQDPLTGLANRAGFDRNIKHAIASGQGANLALLYIDLDYFKPVNDQYGHAAGDQVLQLFAKRLLNIVRPSDVVARLGGDEFAIVLARLNERMDAQTIAEKVLAAAHEPFHVEDRLITIGASIGVAYGVDPDAGHQDLVARADAKLFKAKKAGRGRQMGVDS